MQRHILGFSAIILLAGAIAFIIWPPQSAGAQGVHSACNRVGALCAVLWLAYRELERLPAWILTVIPVATVLVALRPRWAFIVGPLVIALMVLGSKKKPNTRGR